MTGNKTETFVHEVLLKFKDSKTFNFENYTEEDRFAWNLLVKRKLIEHVSDTEFYITSLGVQVIKLEGWDNYLNFEHKRELSKIQKEEYDYKISKFQAKTTFVPYIVSLISLIVACLAYFKPLNKPNKEQLSKDEIIHIADSISTSNQTKTDDSLHSSKIQSDSLIVD